MIRYRYYLADSAKHIKESEALECETDSEAAIIVQETLRRRPEFYSVEVWEGTRCVKKVDRASL